MISVAILSVCLVLIAGSFVISLRAIELSKDYFRAGLFLEEKALELSSSDIKEGFSKGLFSDFDKRFSWTLGIVKIEEESPHEVSLQVSWNQGVKKHGLSILTYL